MATIEFQHMRVVTDDHTPHAEPLTHIPPTRWEIPDAAAETLSALNDVDDVLIRREAQLRILRNPHLDTPTHLLAYAHHRTFRLTFPR